MSDEQRSYISSESRYIAAWAELNARINIRVQISVYHVGSIIGLAAAYFAIQGSDGSSFSRLIPSILMPITSTVFVLFYVHNDLIIGLISAFCSELEKNGQESNTYIMPNWFFGKPASMIKGVQYSKIQSMALAHRTFSDAATIILCFISPIFVVYSLCSNFNYIILFLFFLSVCWLVFIIYALWAIKRYRLELLENVYDSDNGLWKTVTMKGLTPTVFFRSYFVRINNICRLLIWHGIEFAKRRWKFVADRWKHYIRRIRKRN